MSWMYYFFETVHLQFYTLGIIRVSSLVNASNFDTHNFK